MHRTIAETISQRAQVATDTWLADVLLVDVYISRIVVNIKGASGPRSVRVAQHINLGTPGNQLVFPGAKVQVQLVENQFIAVAILSNPGASANFGVTN